MESTRFQTRGSVLALVGVLLVSSPVRAQPAKESELFNGRDLTGWVVDGPRDYTEGGKVLPIWSVKDGLLICAGKKFGFLRYDVQQFADFVLRVEYRLAQKGNSGIGIRTVPYDSNRTRETRPSLASYEIQLLDDAGKPPNTHSSCSLYRYVAPRANPVKPAGQWNTVEVECKGPRIRVTMNGQEVVDVDQSQIEALKAKPLRGYICVQSHTNLVEFRSIRIRELKTGEDGR